jgi:MFS family permease
MATATEVRHEPRSLNKFAEPGQQGTPVRQPRESRRLRPLVYGLALASATFQMAIVPLVPDYARRFGLSGFQQGLLLSATAFSTMAVSLPAGRLADRFGSRSLTVAAAVLLAVASVASASSPSFAWLFVSRLIFGAGYGVVWTAGLAWLAGDSANQGRGLGGTVAASGVGGILGPAIAGVMAQWAGLGAPWWVGAVVFLVLALGLMTVPASEHVVSREPAGLFSAFGDMVRNRSIVAAIAAVVAAGLSWNVAYLLAPNQLHARGVGAGSIGLVLSVAAVLYVIGSAAASSFGPKAVRVKVIIFSLAALAFSFLPAVASEAPATLTFMLCAGAVTRAVMWTVSYPLAARGAEQRGLGLGVVMGAVQAIWAATSVISPMVAGAAAGSAGPAVVYFLAALATLAILAVAVAWMSRRQVAAWARATFARAGAHG